MQLYFSYFITYFFIYCFTFWFPLNIFRADHWRTDWTLLVYMAFACCVTVYTVSVHTGSTLGEPNPNPKSLTLTHTITAVLSK